MWPFVSRCCARPTFRYVNPYPCRRIFLRHRIFRFCSLRQRAKSIYHFSRHKFFSNNDVVPRACNDPLYKPKLMEQQPTKLWSSHSPTRTNTHVTHNKITNRYITQVVCPHYKSLPLHKKSSCHHTTFIQTTTTKHRRRHSISMVQC